MSCLTILSGGFVAGLDAGRIFNTFPLMGGRLIPMGYGAVDGWRNVFENPTAAQLHHRFLAIATTLAVLAACAVAFARSWPRSLRHGLSVAAVVVVAQLTLGVVTLLLAVPIPMAVLHQLTALVLLAILLVIAQRATSESGFSDVFHLPGRTNGPGFDG
jgi:cytochrome c oxidase assembly protein subunit 15